MPFYSYHCAICDKVDSAYRHVSDRHNGPQCCDQKMMMVIVAPAIQPDIPGYESPVTGKWIEGKSARREDLRRTGCRPYEGPSEERQEAARQKAYEEQKSDTRLHDIASKSFYSLSVEKQRQLSRG